MFLLLSSSTLIIYQEDCNNLVHLTDITINSDDCISYAVENPDATGAEIITALTTKPEPELVEKPQLEIDTTLLDRTLIP